MSRKLVRVVAALIQRGSSVLVQQRSPGSARGMLWEFPGGKIEPEETEARALARECREELGIEVAVSDLEARNIHTYADLDIELLLYRCSIVSGEPQALHAHAVRYVDIGQLRQLPFCDADIPFVERLVAGHPSDRS